MTPFTVASWNVHMGLHNDDARGKTARSKSGQLNDVVAGCVALNADVLVLQEACWWPKPDTTAQGDDLIDQVAHATGTTAHRYVSRTVPRHYPVPWSIAVFTRLNATRLDDVALPSLGRERAMIRLLLDDLNLTIGGGHHDGIHSLRRRPDIWLKQWRTLKQAATQCDVIMGDMNMWGPVIERNVPGMRRAVIGRTWPAWRPHSQIDHILVNERVDVIGADVLPNMNSDHRAVRAQLQRV